MKAYQPFRRAVVEEVADDADGSWHWFNLEHLSCSITGHGEEHTVLKRAEQIRLQNVQASLKSTVSINP